MISSRLLTGRAGHAEGQEWGGFGLRSHTTGWQRFAGRIGFDVCPSLGRRLREDFRPDSDVDLLVSFEEGARYSLFDLVTMQDELQAILGREVDLVEREAVEQSENYIRRRHILQNEEPVYVAG